MTLQIKQVRVRNKKETIIEQYLCQRIKELGGIPYKFTAPGRRSVPDRLCVMPLGIIIFVEVKRPNEEPTPAQKVEISKIHSRHHWVVVVDSKGAVNHLIEQYKLKFAYQQKFMKDLLGKENIQEVKHDDNNAM